MPPRLLELHPEAIAEAQAAVQWYRFPFAVIYREKAEVIELIAVAHGKRKPGYWRGR